MVKAVGLLRVLQPGIKSAKGRAVELPPVDAFMNSRDETAVFELALVARLKGEQQGVRIEFRPSARRMQGLVFEKPVLGNQGVHLSGESAALAENFICHAWSGLLACPPAL
jgi:hypothetical protein